MTVADVMSVSQALKNADSLIEDVLEFADMNNDGKISYEGQLHVVNSRHVRLNTRH